MAMLSVRGKGNNLYLVIWFNYKEMLDKGQGYSNYVSLFIMILPILLFSSHEPKTQVSFSDHNLSVIRHHWKLFFSRTTWPISTELGTKHSLVKVFFLDKRPLPFLRGNDKEKAEIHEQNLKILFSRTTSVFQPNLAQSNLEWSEFKFLQRKGPTLFLGEMKTK